MKTLSALSLGLALAGAMLVCLHAMSHAADRPPNIVFILADDMGYGDVHVLNSQRGKILTPNIDKLAAEGMALTDAHTSSSVCTVR